MAKNKVGVNAGQWYVEAGKLASGKQQRFYLGRVNEVSEDEARVRRFRLRDFWKKLDAATWTDETVTQAKDIGKGATVVLVPSRSGSGVERVDLDTGNVQMERIPQDVPAMLSRAMGRTAGEGLSVHHWLQKFAEYAIATKMTFDEDAGKNETSEWGHNSARQVKYLTMRVTDMPVSRLDYKAIEAVVITIANRPVSDKTNKPIATKYASSLIKAWKAFIKWLPKQTDWRKPEDWDEAFTAHRPKKNNVEKAAKAIGKVDAYTIHQLPVIWQYATPYERVLFLLSLNCGFGAIEISTLKNDQCHTSRTGDSHVRRVRLKTADGVYGEHWLFPETAEAIDWSRSRTAAILKRPMTRNDPIIVRTSGERLVKLTKVGNRTNKVANAWYELTKRIQRDQPDFPSLSFGKMRKTSGNLIKQFSDGETVAVFHQRSSAVESDDEAELYSDRDYPKVFAAQKKVHALLKPMFEQVPQPFEGMKKMYTSHSTVDRIKRLWNEDVKPDQIAKMTATSRATVYRNRPSNTSHTLSIETIIG